MCHAGTGKIERAGDRNVGTTATGANVAVTDNLPLFNSNGLKDKVPRREKRMYFLFSVINVTYVAVSVSPQTLSFS